MSEVESFTPAEHLDHWRLNVALECSGASLCAIESIAVGGAVLTMASLLEALEWASAEIECLSAQVGRNPKGGDLLGSVHEHAVGSEADDAL